MKDRNAVDKVAWSGGDVPPVAAKDDREFRQVRSYFFQSQLVECGGLDLWKCAGTSSMERARIFWKRASYDAWRTIQRKRAARS